VAAYEVRFSPRALEDWESLSPDVAARIGRKLREVEADPRPRGDTIVRLQGFSAPHFRLRIGDYRAVFAIEAWVVVVLRIIHRSELERALRDILV
jgi:mRNA-degrading endonuclease RelE of RelBE toxin-antitoxin system